MKNLIDKLIIKCSSFLPINKRKILFLSYYGAQYGGNPKYISEYLKENSKNLDIVWAFTNPDKYHLIGVRKVIYHSIRFFYELCTAKVIITNYRMPVFFSKRKGQIYIQTWHSSLRLKTIEKDAEDKLPSGYVEMAKKDSKAIDCLISGCKFSTNIFARSFWYNGFILECGTPRNDIFFKENSKLKKKVCEKYGLPETNRLLLYAPTFRQNGNYDCYNIDYALLKKTLNRRFGGQWTLMVRLHPHLLASSKQLLCKSDVEDVTSYDDIQELLRISDILISDYSSLIFDYAFTGNPCFLYIPDWENYIKNERNLYFEIRELPFVKAYSNADLMEKIIDYNETIYHENLKKFNQKVGSFEEGTSCQSILNYINEKIKDDYEKDE